MANLNRSRMSLSHLDALEQGFPQIHAAFTPATDRVTAAVAARPFSWARNTGIAVPNTIRLQLFGDSRI
jgi:hypothetical protein